MGLKFKIKIYSETFQNLYLKNDYVSICDIRMQAISYSVDYKL